jgi:hypothetical protein
VLTKYTAAGALMFSLKTSQLMLYREIIAVCSQIHTKHINILCGQNVGFVSVKLVVYIMTTMPYRADIKKQNYLQNGSQRDGSTVWEKMHIYCGIIYTGTA